MRSAERTARTARDNRRMGFFWGGALVMLGVAILLGFLFPTIFNFWACAGIFLGGTGVIGIILDLSMQNINGLWFSIPLTVAGLLVLIGNLFGSGINALPWILIGIAVVLIGVGIIIRFIIKKE